MINALETEWTFSIEGCPKLLEVMPDGTIFVRGEKVDDNKVIYQAVKDFFEQPTHSQQIRRQFMEFDAAHPEVWGIPGWIELRRLIVEGNR
jgi:hypothetical protein